LQGMCCQRRPRNSTNNPAVLTVPSAASGGSSDADLNVDYVRCLTREDARERYE